MRVVEIVVAEPDADTVRRFLAAAEPASTWELAAADRQVVFRALVAATEVEDILDPLQTALAGREGWRIVLLPVEASLPRVAAEIAPEAAAERRGKALRISREELLQHAQNAARITPEFLVTVVLSTVVAAIGLWRSSPAIIIGAMVVAPLLGPNVALALATTLGDSALTQRALRTNLVGVSVALSLSFLLGLGVTLPDNVEVAARTHADLLDLLLALSAGIAGALAFSSNLVAALVGVMVAVALLPPLVVFGMLLGDGRVEPALQALLLLCANVVCVLLAAIGTFLLQGIGPSQWWRAAAARRRAVAVLLLLLVLLGAVAMILERPALGG